MSEPKRYSFWGMIVHLPGGGVRPEVHFKIDEDGLFVGYPDYEKLKAEVERLRASSFVTAVPSEHYERVIKAGDAMVEHILKIEEDVYEVMPCSGCYVIKGWNAAKEGKPSV